MFLRDPQVGNPWSSRTEHHPGRIVLLFPNTRGINILKRLWTKFIDRWRFLDHIDTEHLDCKALSRWLSGCRLDFAGFPFHRVQAIIHHSLSTVNSWVNVLLTRSSLTVWLRPKRSVHKTPVIHVPWAASTILCPVWGSDSWYSSWLYAFPIDKQVHPQTVCTTAEHLESFLSVITMCTGLSNYIL